MYLDLIKAGLLFIQSDNPSNMVKLNGKCAKYFYIYI